MTSSSPQQYGSVLTQTKLADLPSFTPVQQIGPVLAAGTMLLGRFHLIEEIGAGGMGRVFSAWDAFRESHVAIKVLTDLMMAQESAQKRFMTEAAIALQLSHPNIVRVFDVQQDMGLTFIVMELLSGYSLRQWMENYRQNHAKFEVAEAKRIGLAILEALTVAHQVTVHRDIKPENIFVNGDGMVKLMDFGIARDLSQSQLTHTTVTVGTAYYMAPEQLSAARTVDGRADLYALGVVLYEMLTGVVPTGMAQGIRSIRPDVPTGLAKVIEKALAQLPDQRHSNALEFKTAMETGRLAGQRWWSGNPAVTKVAAGVGAAALAGALLVFGAGQLSDAGGSWLTDNMPAFGAEGEKLQADVMTIDAEVKDLRRSLETIRNAAPRDPDPAYVSLVGDAILSSAEWAKLDSRQQMAAIALRDKSYRKATRLYADAKREYEARLAAIKSIKPMLAKVSGVKALAKSTRSALEQPVGQAISEVEGGKLFTLLADPQGAAKASEALRSVEGILGVETSRLNVIAMRQADEQRKKDEEARQVAAAKERQRQEAEVRRREEELRQREAALAQQRQRETLAAEQRQREALAAEQRQREANLAQQRQRDAQVQEQRQRDADARQREAEARQRAAAASQQEREEREAALAQRRAQACTQARYEHTGTALGFALCSRKNNCVPDAQQRMNAAQQKVDRLC